MNNGFVRLLIIILVFVFNISIANSQCAICTKTASQLGEGPAHALNTAIVYLMFTPFAIIGFIGYRWWRSQKNS